MFYRQVLDIYATSIDYDPKADTSVLFFKKVQNKMHFAVHGQTAAEVIYSRADAEKATGEYRKYQQKTLSSVEKAFLDSIKTIEKKTSKKLEQGKNFIMG